MDVPVLRYVDVFIGLALIMLLGCSVVAALTQLITSGFYLRAQYLRQGLADILQQLDPGAKDMDCQYVAKLIQRHPLVSRPATLPGELLVRIQRALFKNSRWMPSGAPAVVVQKHELLSILLEWASGEGVLGGNKQLAVMTLRLRSVLQANGLHSPAETLNAMRHQVVAQERAFPERGEHLWHSAAFIDSCPPVLVAKVHNWYDAMAARTSQRFTLQSRWITTAIAGGLLLFVFPIDTLDLIKRLSLDDKLRESLVRQAEKKLAETKDEKELKTVQENLKEVQAAALELRTVAAPFDIQFAFPPVRGGAGFSHLPGILLSWVLLTLGTPFWYDALKNLLKFRSVIAQKDDEDRKDRQRNDTALPRSPAADQTAAAGVIAVAAQPVSADESGDKDELNAVG